MRVNPPIVMPINNCAYLNPPDSPRSSCHVPSASPKAMMRWILFVCPAPSRNLHLIKDSELHLVSSFFSISLPSCGHETRRSSFDLIREISNLKPHRPRDSLLRTMSTKPVPIPGPKGVPFVGNVYDIEREVPLNSMELMADNYGMCFCFYSISIYEDGMLTRYR